MGSAITICAFIALSNGCNKASKSVVQSVKTRRISPLWLEGGISELQDGFPKGLMKVKADRRKPFDVNWIAHSHRGLEFERVDFQKEYRCVVLSVSNPTSEPVTIIREKFDVAFIAKGQPRPSSTANTITDDDDPDEAALMVSGQKPLHMARVFMSKIVVQPKSVERFLISFSTPPDKLLHPKGVGGEYRAYVAFLMHDQSIASEEVALVPLIQNGTTSEIKGPRWAELDPKNAKKLTDKDRQRILSRAITQGLEMMGRSK